MRFFFGNFRPNTVYRKADHVGWKTVEGAAVLVDNRETELLRLNETASAVWKQIDGIRSLGEIAAAVEEAFDAPARRIRRDVESFVRKLVERELVVAQP